MSLDDLAALAACVRLYDATTGDDLGLAHLPRPVQLGEVAACEHGPPLRVVALVDVDPGRAVDMLAGVEPARLVVAG